MCREFFHKELFFLPKFTYHIDLSCKLTESFPPQKRLIIPKKCSKKWLPHDHKCMDLLSLNTLAREIVSDIYFLAHIGLYKVILGLFPLSLFLLCKPLSKSYLIYSLKYIKTKLQPNVSCSIL